MTLQLPEGLPALDVLRAEGYASGHRANAARWQPRPIEIAVLNLMPNKAATEVQLARLLASTPFDVRVTLLMPDGHVSHTTPAEHLARFYRPWSTVRHQSFDGLIVTGAPVETIPCEDVAYWPELTRILDWTKGHVSRSCYICWGAMAAVYHFHGVRTPVLAQKRFGVYWQTVREAGSPWLRGFGDTFPVPVSRKAELQVSALPRTGGLSVLADAEESGVCLLAEAGRGALYMFNHLEYDATTLRDEYFRDLRAGGSIGRPANYFPDDDPACAPTNTWRPFAQLFFTNWVADICDAVLPSDDGERCLDWLLAEPAAARGLDGFADFLVVANETPRLLPELLQHIADAGHRSLAARVHRRPAGTSLVELRVEDLRAEGAERLARDLLRTPNVRRVVLRQGRGCETGSGRRPPVHSGYLFSNTGQGGVAGPRSQLVH